MNEDILKQAREICDKQIQEASKNWTIKEFSPMHSYDYMFMTVYMRLFKEKMILEGKDFNFKPI
jgi:hypothetical protein